MVKNIILASKQKLISYDVFLPIFQKVFESYS